VTVTGFRGFREFRFLGRPLAPAPELFVSWRCTDRRLCHHWIVAGLLQLSVLRHVKHKLPEVTDSTECCCTNCLPISTTPTSLSRAS